MVNAGWPTKADRCSKHIDHPRKLLFAGHSVRHWSLEGFRTHRGIAHRVSDLGVAQVTLKPPRIHASASQGIACAVAQHVDMHREAVWRRHWLARSSCDAHAPKLPGRTH